jgi:phosphate transport system substrate-binding protein
VNITSTRRRAVAALIAGTLLVAACGDDDDDGGSETTSAVADTTDAATSDTAAPAATTESPSTDSDGSADGTTSQASSDGGGGAPAGDASGEIFVSGSSTVEPISIAAGDAFANANPAVAVTVEGPGTGDGFARFCAGETDISDASRPISAEEVETCESNGIEFIELPIATDGLSVITSAEDTEVECLSFVDLWALLGPDSTGINNWSGADSIAEEVSATVTDLGAVHTPYPDAPLAITAPGEESGTFDSFVELVIDKVGAELGQEDATVRPDYTASPNDNVIIEGIGSNPTSLGWVGFAFVEENLDVVKPLEVDGGGGCVEPTAETIASGDYPIARTLYIYVNAAKVDENPALEPFVDYYVSEGITSLIGADEGQVPYVALNDEAVAETTRVWESKETGTRDGGS